MKENSKFFGKFSFKYYQKELIIIRNIRDQLFKYLNNIRTFKILRIRIRIVLFGPNYSNNSNNTNIRSNTGREPKRNL